MTCQPRTTSAFPQFVVIADDLTGANDTGIAFAKAGLKTVVSILPSNAQLLDSSVDVAVLSTHSRHLAPRLAQEKVMQSLAPFSRASLDAPASCAQHPWIYKKIDSTLRGNPGAELWAVMDSLGTDRALIAPAFPGQGRTTVGGLQMVHNVPLAESSFGKEVPESEVAHFFAKQGADLGVERASLAAVREGHESLVARFAQSTAALFVADAETDDDLLILARAGVECGFRLFCGSAGLANALTQAIGLQPQLPAQADSDGQEVRWDTAGPLIVVAGSRHPQTARQVEAFCTSVGYDSVLRLQPASICNASLKSGASLAKAELETALAALAQHQHLVIAIADLDLNALDGETIVERLGQWVQHLLSHSSNRNLLPRRMILTGGDVAMAVCMALSCTALRLHGEIEAGIPLGELLDGPYAGLPLVTKAGGFGSDSTFAKALA